MTIFVFAQKNAITCIGEQDKRLDKRITFGLLSLQRVAHQEQNKVQQQKYS